MYIYIYTYIYMRHFGGEACISSYIQLSLCVFSITNVTRDSISVSPFWPSRTGFPHDCSHGCQYWFLKNSAWNGQTCSTCSHFHTESHVFSVSVNIGHVRNISAHRDPKQQCQQCELLLGQVSTGWCPSSLAFSWCISPITMVYRWYICSEWDHNPFIIGGSPPWRDRRGRLPDGRCFWNLPFLDRSVFVRLHTLGFQTRCFVGKRLVFWPSKNTMRWQLVFKLPSTMRWFDGHKGTVLKNLFQYRCSMVFIEHICFLWATRIQPRENNRIKDKEFELKQQRKTKEHGEQTKENQDKECLNWRHAKGAFNNMIGIFSGFQSFFFPEK